VAADILPGVNEKTCSLCSTHLLTLLLLLFPASSLRAEEPGPGELEARTTSVEAENGTAERGTAERGTAERGTAERGTADDPAVEAVYHFARAKLLADNGAFEEALEAFRRSLELDDGDPYALVEAAKLHLYLGQISHAPERQLDRLRTAAEYAARARALAPENVDVLRTFARIHLRLVENEQLDSLPLAQGAFEKLHEMTEGDLQVLTSLGQLYLWQRRSEEAAAVLREAASFRPSHPTIQNMLVESLLGAGANEEAAEVLGRLVELEPTAIEHRLRLAELRSEQGDHAGAVEALRDGPEDLFTSPRLRQLLARELHLSGDNEEALRIADSLLGEHPTGYGLRRLRVAIFSSLTRYREAIDELEPLLADPEHPSAVQDTLLLGQLLERVGRSAEAIETLRRLLGRVAGTGDELQVKMSLVGVLEREGEIDTAATLLEEELAAAEPSSAVDFARMLAQLLADAGRFEEGVALLERTLESPELDATDPEAAPARLQQLAILAAEEEWPRVRDLSAELLEPSETEAPGAQVRLEVLLLHARALAHLGELGRALELLSAPGTIPEDGTPRLVATKIGLLFDHGREAEGRREVAELAASGEVGDLFLAAQIHQQGERYEEAIPYLERVVEQDPESIVTLFALGAAQERSGRVESAVATFERLLELAPGYAPALNYLGYTWAERGEQLERALEMTRRAVSLEPNNGAYVDSLGWVYFQLGRYQEAREHLEWAVRLVPDDPTLREHLGDLYVALQDVERARASYRQALDLGIEEIEQVDQLRRKLETLEQKGL